MQTQKVVQKPKVAIIILNYISFQNTLSIVKELHNKLEYDHYEIIVVDNNSPNESYQQLLENSGRFGYHFIRNMSNSGYASGNNLGIRFSYKLQAKYSWIINNDILIDDPFVLEKMVDMMEKNELIGVISPRVMKKGRGEEYPFILRPNRWQMSLGYFSYAKKRKVVSVNNRRIYKPQGCCMLLRNSDMNKVGELDEDTFLYCEEDILAERLLKINKECWLCADTKIIHNHSTTVYSVMKKCDIAKNNAESYGIYLKKYRNIKDIFWCNLICCIKYLVIYLRY